MEIDYCAVTDRGLSRQQNEDAVLAVRRPRSGDLLLAVADGVGGLFDGAGASRLLIDRLASLAGAAGDAPLRDSVAATLSAVNDELFERALREPAHLSGSTVVVAIIARAALRLLHAGDSRAYLLRGRSLLRLTEDHSVVAEQVRAGLITEEEAAVSPQRNVITVCVGTERYLDPAMSRSIPLHAGDLVLLSTDGLHGVVPAAEIAGLLAAARNAEEAAASLVARANALGGPDNISVAVARVVEA